MEVREVSTTIMASAQERAAVAELMAPSESLVGHPSLDVTMSTDPHEPLLLSPAEPTDDPEDI